MSIIYVVRHGQDFDNANKILNGHRNESLTPLGREQAQATGLKLQGKDIKFVYCSPTLRTRQTAEIISEIIGVKKDDIIVEPKLIERDFGVLTGKSVSEISKYSQHIFQGDKIDFFLDGEGVESYDALLFRAKEVLAQITAEHSEDNLLLVTHGGLGKMIEAVWHNWSWEYALTRPYFDNADVIELKK